MITTEDTKTKKFIVPEINIKELYETIQDCKSFIETKSAFKPFIETMIAVKREV